MRFSCGFSSVIYDPQSRGMRGTSLRGFFLPHPVRQHLCNSCVECLVPGVVIEPHHVDAESGDKHSLLPLQFGQLIAHHCDSSVGSDTADIPSCQRMRHM